MRGKFGTDGVRSPAFSPIHSVESRSASRKVRKGPQSTEDIESTHRMVKEKGCTRIAFPGLFLRGLMRTLSEAWSEWKRFQANSGAAGASLSFLFIAYAVTTNGLSSLRIRNGGRVPGGVRLLVRLIDRYFESGFEDAPVGGIMRGASPAAVSLGLRFSSRISTAESFFSFTR